MSESTINQRLKFLIDALGLKVGAFSRLLGVSETSTRNYTDRSSKPGFDYLEKIASHFKQVNLTWLITGEGEHFLSPPNENEQPTRHEQKFFRSSVAGTNNGIGYQEQGNNSQSDSELHAKLTLAEKEVEHLRMLLAAKDQTIQILLSQQPKP